MKIIDNKKDYYDYLCGVYGIDESVVYDRRGSVRLASDSDFNRYLARGVKFCYNNQQFVMKLVEKHGPKQFNWWNFDEGTRDKLKNEVYYGNLATVCVSVGFNKYKFIIDRWVENGVVCGQEFLVDVSKRPKNQPITLLEYAPEATRWYSYTGINCIENPIFEGTWIPKYIDAKDVWESIYAYVSATKDKDIADNRTNQEKIISNGFDTKTSFRKM